MRWNLIKAREQAHLSQRDLAALLGVERKAIGRWERGTHTPQPFLCGKIEAILDPKKEKNLFYNFPDETDKTNKTEDPEPCSDVVEGDRLDSSDSHADVLESEVEEVIEMDPTRRKLNGTVATGIMAVGTGATLVNNFQVLTGFTIDPAKCLAQSRLAISRAWRDLNEGDYPMVEQTLDAYVSTITQFAYTFSPFQSQAATIALQAKILQIYLANMDMRFSDRELYCTEAIQFAALSGDPNLLAIARYWQGDTYTYCYRQPKRAITILNKALKSVDGDTSITTRIYSDLAIAHAQKHDESGALDYVKLAYSTMPSTPLPNNHLSVGPSEFAQMEGKAYLYLAEYLPGYAQQAYDAFNRSTSKPSNSKGYRIQVLIRKADAASALGDKKECVTCLTQSLEFTPNQDELSQARDVLNGVPDKWKSETDVQELQKAVDQELQKAVDNALVIASQ